MTFYVLDEIPHRLPDALRRLLTRTRPRQETMPVSLYDGFLPLMKDGLTDDPASPQNAGLRCPLPAGALPAANFKKILKTD